MSAEYPPHGTFEPIPEGEPAGIFPQCDDPNHIAVAPAAIPPGHRYRHICPKCGAQTLFYPFQWTVS